MVYHAKVKLIGWFINTWIKREVKQVTIEKKDCIR